MQDLIALAVDPAAWAALATLIVMEVVLGIDNLIFISILTNKLPAHQQAKARRIGIGLALVLRLGLLGTVAFIVQLTAAGLHGLRARLLLARPDPDRAAACSWSGRRRRRSTTTSIPIPSGDLFDGRAATLGFGAAIVQILLLDLVFSHRQHHHRRRHDRARPDHGDRRDRRGDGDAARGRLRSPRFIERNPTVVMLALGFLLMIGMTLIAEGFGVHVPKGYIYAAMAFSALVEGLNMLSRRARRGRAREPAPEPAPLAEQSPAAEPISRRSPGR